MNKEIEIPEGYEARIEGNKVILEPKQESEPVEIKYAGKIYKVYGTKELPGGIVGYIIEDEPGHYDCIIHPDEVLGGGYGVKSNGSPYPTKDITFDEKPAEWSEEDETAYGDLIWCIEQARKSAKGENDLGNIWFTENWVKNRLKSIRPQSHWKPSKEQLSALKEQTSWLSKDNPLHSLYYQLCEL